MKQRIPQLDAIRGIAIWLVIMVHASDKYPSLHLMPVFRNGWMGVDLFFVLSGLLITGILVDAKKSKDYFRNFYVRRCLRIWPLYYSLLLFMFVVVPLLRPSEANLVFEKSSPWWAYPLFLQNFLIPFPTMATGPLAVTWSLAIEEQFYLVWPLVIRYFSSAQVRRIAITVICVSPVLRFYLSMHHFLIYSNLFCRLDGLMAGALLALALRSEGFDPSQFTKIAWVCLFFATPLAFVAEFLGARWLTFSFTAIASLSLVFLALFSTQRWLQAALQNRFIVYTGSISYGLYLLHKIPFDMAQTFRLDKHPVLAFPVGIAASYVLAAISFHLLEKPFLKLKRFFEPAPARREPAKSEPARPQFEGGPV